MSREEIYSRITDRQNFKTRKFINFMNQYYEAKDMPLLNKSAEYTVCQHKNKLNISNAWVRIYSIYFKLISNG